MHNTRNIPKENLEPFHYRHRNFFVGIFLIIPLLAIPIMLVFLLVKSELLENWCDIHIKCETATGLNKATQVTILGKRVGNVKFVKLNDHGYVDVTLRVKRKYSHFIHKDSKALLKQKNFVVGDWEIDLSVGNTLYPPIKDGDTLNVEYQVRLEKLVEVFTDMLIPLESIFESLENGEGIIKYLFGKDTIMGDMHHLFDKVHTLLERADGTLVNANSMIGNLESFGVHGTEMVDTLMIFSQKANVLIDEFDILFDNIDTLLGGVDTIVGGFNDLPADVNETISLLKSSLVDAQLLLKAIQEHWFFRRSIKRMKKKLDVE